MKVAIYLCGNGTYREPRLIEMQYLRIIRYIGELQSKSDYRVEVVNTYIDLNVKRSTYFEDLPGLYQLVDDIKEKDIDVVILDMKLDEKFGSGKYYPIMNTLADTGAEIYNCYYDDNDVMLTKLKRMYGNNVNSYYLPDDAEEFITLFPTLAANIAYEVIKESLEDSNVLESEDLEKVIIKDISELRNEIPYGNVSSLPWLSPATKLELRKIMNKELDERRKVEDLFIMGPNNSGMLWDEVLFNRARNEDEGEWVRDRLVKIGFRYNVDGKNHSFTMEYGRYIIYADPRIYCSIEIFIYDIQEVRGTKDYYQVGRFKIPDHWKNELNDKVIRRVDDIVTEYEGK